VDSLPTLPTHKLTTKHSQEEIKAIKTVFKQEYARYGWDGVYQTMQKRYGYKRSFLGMINFCHNKLGLYAPKKPVKPDRMIRVGRFPELERPGQKVQIDVKHVPSRCLRGLAREHRILMYQWTAIDECTRLRYIFAYTDFTPHNSANFLRRAISFFPFPIETVQTDNGFEFTYRYMPHIPKKNPFEAALERAGIRHKLIAPAMPWHNGKVERSHCTDQKWFYNWETFENIQELNVKLEKHLRWYNNRPLITLGELSPRQRLAAKIKNAV
jgi:hypothetical protein